MDTMRERFTSTVTELLDASDRVAVITAVIGAADFIVSGAARRHPDRVINVGIREQLMIGAAAGMALEGLRPIVHSYAPFLVERPFEQVKLDFAHQDVGAILVSIGGSYDWPEGGRTHMAPGDVALISTLPDWDVFVPGHPDELEAILRSAAETDRRTYLRLSTRQNREPVPPAVSGLALVKPAHRNAPLVVAVGPMLDNVLAATADLEVAVAYTAMVRPFDATTLRRLAGDRVVLVEPYLRGTSAHQISDALDDRAIRLTSLGVGTNELRSYGSPAEHEAAWGLDAEGLRRSLTVALDGTPPTCSFAAV
jgi:transketolase